jgi:hypothetical protein
MAEVFNSESKAQLPAWHPGNANRCGSFPADKRGDAFRREGRRASAPRRQQEPGRANNGYCWMENKRIQTVAAELADSKKLLKQEKKNLKKAKGKLAKDNKKRVMQVIEAAVEALEDQQTIIKNGGQIPVT